MLDIKSVVEDLGRRGTPRGHERGRDVRAPGGGPVPQGQLEARTPRPASRIQAIAEEIKAQNATKVRVFGFTDNLGSYAHGVTLSKKRAEAVHDELAAAGLGADVTFEVRGYSEDYPIADNTSEQGRRKNRRVEVTFPKGD